MPTLASVSWTAKEQGARGSRREEERGKKKRVKEEDSVIGGFSDTY